MNTITLFSLIVFATVFAAVYINNTTTGATPIVFTPPYSYASGGDLLSELNAFLFTFIFSLLFFGLSAPIALGIEGAKYAGLFTQHLMSAFDFAFLLPQVIAVFAATLLGQAIIDDYTEKRSLLEGWTDARNYFLAAFVLFIVVFLVKMLLLPAVGLV
ncbi:MAG TPA: hypothetical protein VGQ00_02405 [Candidatus Norongarragalinales archaeon]|jgi:hypothetical protein|nr:hypothetical protein [Candidatus Norongarragalinales archaeon]